MINGTRKSSSIVILAKSVNGSKNMKIKIITSKSKPYNLFRFWDLITWSMVFENVGSFSSLPESVDTSKHMKTKGLNQDW